MLARGVGLDEKVRQKGWRGLKQQLRKAIDIGSVSRPRTYDLLIRGLSVYLDQQAAFKALPGKIRVYKVQIRGMLEELEGFSRTLPKYGPWVLQQMIEEWIVRAQEMARETEPMEAETTPSILPVSPAVATAERRAGKMDSEPTAAETPAPTFPSQPTVGNAEVEGDDVGEPNVEPTLGGMDFDEMELSKALSPELLTISPTTRRQQNIHLLKCLKGMCKLATKKHAERLDAQEL